MARLIVDTSGYLIGTIPKHPLYGDVREVLTGADQPPVVSPLVVAEIDYMVLDKAGVEQELAVIDDLTGGAYELPDLDSDDLRAARHLVAKHRDLRIGLTDAVNAVLAERYETNEILTADQRHFRTVTPLTRRFDAFRLLPFDR
ncbi:PIN domain-containing protein [Actinocrinis puniceicyclus]|uniref:Ribonuclease VapC n=1 Tax=Actinocrinis puniceicyclus TaxID=977794 RepID=A0A8J8BA36_9ACTN|nr:PIN domain-containing protein [Actinocrinis puniceicyclus]MBS2962527.1 PIN domain-containing protein [Actinocrinis puniceicyclus]